MRLSGSWILESDDLALLLFSCVSLGKLLDFSGPWFPDL